MTTQPEAQRPLERFFKNGEWTTAEQILAAAELRRLYAENQALADSLAAKADRIDRLGELVERPQEDKAMLSRALTAKWNDATTALLRLQADKRELLKALKKCCSVTSKTPAAMRKRGVAGLYGRFAAFAERNGQTTKEGSPNGRTRPNGLKPAPLSPKHKENRHD